MASEKLQKILAMSQNMEKKGTKQNSPKRVLNMQKSLNEQIASADKTIENIDRAYTSPYIPTQEEKESWNYERGRDELTEMADQNVFMEKLKQSKLPTAIIESMRKNPCNYDASTVNGMMGPENALFKKLNEAYAKDKEEPIRGIKAVQQINEQLETRDKQSTEGVTQVSEDTIHNSNTSSIDLTLLEQVIERVIDKKLNILNESISRNLPSQIRSMSITESGSFRFLDNEDNVYECQMKYLGKRKKAKK